MGRRDGDGSAANAGNGRSEDVEVDDQQGKKHKKEKKEKKRSRSVSKDDGCDDLGDLGAFAEKVRAHAACAGPRFDQRRSGGRAGGEEEEEEEGGLTSDTPLRSCCKPVAQPPQQPVKVVLVAFGFKLGAPDYIDFIFDVRSVPNPWKLNDFKVLDGTHTRLQEGLMQIRRAKTMLAQLRRFVVDKCKRFTSTLSPAAAALVAEQGGDDGGHAAAADGILTIGIGCRSGVHRSVALALLLKQRGFMDSCDASCAPVVVPVFRDLAGSDRRAAAAEAMPKSRLVNAPFVCKVCDATCGSVAEWKAHVDGKRHAKRTAKFLAGKARQAADKK